MHTTQTTATIDGVRLVVRVSTVKRDGHEMRRAVVLDAEIAALERLMAAIGESREYRVDLLRSALIGSAEAWSERGAIDAAIRNARRRLRGE